MGWRGFAKRKQLICVERVCVELIFDEEEGEGERMGEESHGEGAES